MKWSFYQFGELVNEHKQLTEANKKQGVHIDSVERNKWQSPGNNDSMGRGSLRPEIQDTPQGAALQKDVRNADWEKALAANPDLAYSAQATKLANQDSRAVDPQAQFDQEVTRRGGRVGQVIRGSTPLNKLEKALEGDTSPEGEMAKQINDFIYSNPAEFQDKNLTPLEWAKQIAHHMPKGGIQGDKEWNTSVMRGFAKLNKLTNGSLLSASENAPGTYDINVDVLADRGTRGHDAASDFRDKSGETFQNATEDGFRETYKELMSLQRELGIQDPKTIDAAKKLVDLGNNIKSSAGISSKLFQSIAKAYNKALDIANPSDDLSDLY